MKPNQEKILKFITIGGATAAGLATFGVVGLPLNKIYSKLSI